MEVKKIEKTKKNKEKIKFPKKDIELDEESYSEEEVKLEKPKRKVNYIMTEARKLAFEKARKVRSEKIAKSKAEKEQKEKEYNDYKESLKAKKDAKKRRNKKKK